MDIFYAIVIIVLIFVLMSFCGWCCKKREGTVYNSSPTIVPPYPVEPQHPIPHTGGLPPPPPTAGFATNQPPYPTQTPLAMPTPYPPATSPYPPPSTGPIYPMGSHIGSAPYPPPTTADSTLPPSYQEAVSQTVPPPPVREAYNKQAPYNPNY